MKNARFGSIAALSLALLLPLISFSSAHAQTPKIAVIDLSQAFSQYYKTTDAEAILKDRMAGFQKERDQMAADYQKLVDDTQKLRDAANDTTLSNDARAERQKAFETKVQDVRNAERQMQEFNTTRQKQFEDQSRRMRGGIVDEIIKYITDLGTREKYTFIYDKSGLSTNGTPFLIFVSPDIKDITDDVIKAMNANKPATPAASTPPTGAAAGPSVTTPMTIPAAPSTSAPVAPAPAAK